MVNSEASSLNEPPFNSYRQRVLPFFIRESPKALLLHKGDKKDQIHTSVPLSSERWQDGGFRSISVRRFVAGMVVLCRI